MDSAPLVAYESPGSATSPIAPGGPAVRPQPWETVRLYKRRRNDADTPAGSNNGPSTVVVEEDDVGRSNQDAVIRLITALNETIIQQSRLIETLRTEQAELKAGQEQIKTQCTALQSEIQDLKDEIRRHPPSSFVPSSRSWASVAASGATSTTYNTSQSSGGPKNEPNCVRIVVPPNRPDTNEGTTLTRHLPTNAAYNRIKEALDNDMATQNAQLAGIGTTRQGYLIRFRDEESANVARNNTGWIRELGQETRMAEPLFAVVVHRTPTEEVTITSDKTASIAKITEENELTDKGFKIKDIVWLKKKGMPLGTHASLGVWFDSAEAAEWAMRDGMLFGQRYVGSIEAYERKKKRCYKCQAVGHLAWNCKETRRCAHCTLDHDLKDCPPGSTPKCVDCNGGHRTGSSECRSAPSITNNL
jgi:hypothetical protein